MSDGCWGSPSESPTAPGTQAPRGLVSGHGTWRSLAATPASEAPPTAAHLDARRALSGPRCGSRRQRALGGRAPDAFSSRTLWSVWAKRELHAVTFAQHLD